MIVTRGNLLLTVACTQKRDFGGERAPKIGSVVLEVTVDVQRYPFLQRKAVLVRQ